MIYLGSKNIAAIEYIIMHKCHIDLGFTVHMSKFLLLYKNNKSIPGFKGCYTKTIKASLDSKVQLHCTIAISQSNERV